jgi:enoyl-CoA hydratase/carnithine racemase
MTDLIQTSNDGAVLTLRLNRAEKKNAITAAMYSAMAEALRAADTNPDVKVVVITGAGDAFTAGNDLKDFAENPPKDPAAPVFAFMDALAGFNKPVIAAVNGVAVGIGTTLLLHCDLAAAVPGAKFALPFVNLALVPEFASSLLLPQWAGHARAAEKILLGLPFGAAEAQAMGLASAVLPAGEVLSHARAMARRFNALPPGAVRESKRLLKRAQARLVEEAIMEEARAFSGRLGGPEVREAVAAFFEKRPPDFSKTR